MNNKFKAKLTILSFMIFLVQRIQSLSSLTALLPEVESVIQTAKDNLWNQMDASTNLWNMPLHHGTYLLSQYHFQLKVLSINQSYPFVPKFNRTHFAQKLIKEQLKDGSWKYVTDLNKKQGDLDTTIMNYYFLKDFGVGELSQTMLEARKFILKKGGLQKSKIFTKYKLAMLGQYQWNLVNYIPLFLFQKTFPFYSYGYIKDYVSQQAYPFLLNFAYLRYHKSTFIVSNTCISQLMNNRGSPPCTHKTINDTHKFFNKLNESALLTPEQSVDNLLNEALKLYSPIGTFGSTTTNTILTLITLKDYVLRYNQSDNQNYFQFLYKTRVNKSLEYVESLYFNKYSPYYGSLYDSRYGDSLLSIFSLLQSKQPLQKLLPCIDAIEKDATHKNNGIFSGLGFENTPDTDSTAMLLNIYRKVLQNHETSIDVKIYRQKIKGLQKWIQDIQNEDGGFPKFDKNKNDGQYMFVKLMLWLTNIAKSVEPFDPSSADITGHALQALGSYNQNNKKTIMQAVKYLVNSKKQQMWNSRWGINQIHALSAIYPAFSKIGFDMNSFFLFNTTSKLLQTQHQDGGFGQSSQGHSSGRYVNGSSTVTMTAQGLISCLQITHTFQNRTFIDQKIQKSVKYILHNFKTYGKFYDVSVVGTAHRVIANVQYPIYAYTYPLIALARFKKYILQDTKRVIKTDLMQQIFNSTKKQIDEL